MFCPNCGNEISENEKYCSQCGKPLVQDENGGENKNIKNKQMIKMIIPTVCPIE